MTTQAAPGPGRRLTTLVGAPTKHGKTSLFMHLMPGALWLGRRDNIHPVATGIHGLDSEMVYVWEAAFDLQTMVEVLEFPQYAPFLKSRGGIVVDDFTHRCHASLATWDTVKPKGRGGKPDDFWPYQMLKHFLIRFSTALERLDIDFLAGCHEVEYAQPDRSNPNGSPGGVDVGSRSRTKDLPSRFSQVLLLRIDNTSIDPFFNRTLFCDPQDLANQITDDRFHVVGPASPPNLRELLRVTHLGPSAFPRPAGFEWQDMVSDTVAADMLTGPLTIERANEVADKVLASWRAEGRPWDSTWESRLIVAIQSGIARAQVQQARAEGRFAHRRTSVGPAVGGFTAAPLPDGSGAALPDAKAEAAEVVAESIKAGDAPPSVYAGGGAPLPS